MDHQFSKRMKAMRSEADRHGLPSSTSTWKRVDSEKLNDLVLDHQTRINRIEKMARIVFPVMFGIWNAIYWPMLLLRKF